MTVSYKKTGNPEVPAIIMANDHETPVWLQSLWTTGPDAYYINWNGCGHCCAAMAARLQGVEDIDPAKEYARCKECWGEPTGVQDHFQTVLGIVDILTGFGVKAEALGVPEAQNREELEKLRSRLEQELHAGKQVIFWSHPIEGRENENPFSAGEHYVMACGYDEAGNVVIANSGIGVQTVDMDTVMNALYHGARPEVKTWGEVERLDGCGGIVIVGDPKAAGPIVFHTCR